MNLDELRTVLRGDNADKIRSMLDELDQFDAQMAELGNKRSQLDAALNQLLGNQPRQPRAARQSSGGRRGGIRDKVLETITENPNIAPAQIRGKLGIGSGDKSGSQSVSNAISALKREGKIKDGTVPRSYMEA